jgi:hypothetical protein
MIICPLALVSLEATFERTLRHGQATKKRPGTFLRPVNPSGCFSHSRRVVRSVGIGLSAIE